MLEQRYKDFMKFCHTSMDYWMPMRWHKELQLEYVTHTAQQGNSRTWSWTIFDHWMSALKSPDRTNSGWQFDNFDGNLFILSLSPVEHTKTSGSMRIDHFASIATNILQHMLDWPPLLPGYMKKCHWDIQFSQCLHRWDELSIQTKSMEANDKCDLYWKSSIYCGAYTSWIMGNFGRITSPTYILIDI